MTRTGLLGVVYWLLLVALAVAQPATYDQRQEGKINVQVDVKDLQIVALVDSDILGDYSYDYALYDEADFTIKPSTKRTTTVRPSSTTTGSTSTTIASSASSSEAASSTTAKATEEESTAAVTNTTPSEVKIAESTTKYDQVSSTTELTESTTAAASSTASDESTTTTTTTTRRPLGSAEPRKRCPMGFQMRSGRCFKRRHSLISPRLALMKLAPALLGTTFGRHLATGNRITS